MLKELGNVFWFIWRFCKHIYDLPREIKWIFQKVFRKSHVSDCDLWGLCSHLAPIIYYKIKRFSKMHKHGIPMAFCEYEANSWCNKAEYDNAKAKGDIIGGGSEMWSKYINEMRFGFGWNIADDLNLKGIDLMWIHKEVGKWLKDEINKINLRPKEATKELLKDNDNDLIELYEDWKITKVNTHLVYNYSTKLYKKMSERSYKGIKLFGEYFNNLWD